MIKMNNNNSSKYSHLMQRNIKLAYFINFFKHFYFFLPIWYAFETQFAGAGVLGIIYAVSHAITVVFELPTGALADLIGRKKTIIIGMMFEAAAWLLISQTQTTNYLWTGYILVGISSALVSGADEALNFDSLKELGKEKTFAKFSANIGLVVRTAIIIGTFAGGYIYSSWMRLPYILVGLNVAFASIIAFLLKEPKIDSEKFSIKAYTNQTKIGFREILKNEYIKTFSVYYLFTAGFSWYFMFFLNMAYATEIGFSTIQIGQVFAIVYLFASFLNIYITRSENLKRKYVYIGLPLIMAVGYLPGYWSNKMTAVFLLFFIQFVGMARFSLLNQYANLEFQSKYRATAMSSLNMAVSLIAASLSFLTGTIIENYGANLVMTLMGVLTLVTAVPMGIKLFKMKENNLDLAYEKIDTTEVKVFER